MVGCLFEVRLLNLCIALPALSFLLGQAHAMAEDRPLHRNGSSKLIQYRVDDRKLTESLVNTLEKHLEENERKLRGTLNNKQKKS